MRKHRFIIIGIILVSIIVLCMIAAKASCKPSDEAYSESISCDTHTGWVPLPIMEGGEDNEIVEHEHYTLSYNETHEQPNWVWYVVTKDMVNGPAQRESAFMEDPSVSTGSAVPADYKKSGFDRGHLCPAADMRLDNKCMKETFYMSNISPQLHQFNAGIWLDLENYVRELACRYDSLYVVTGPVLKDGLPCIKGKYNKISVPEEFYKIIYSEKHGWMHGYIIPHKTTYKNKKELFMYKVSVDSIESITHIDFFRGVVDEDFLEQ